jgi:hypothetical protein
LRHEIQPVNNVDPDKIDAYFKPHKPPGDSAYEDWEDLVGEAEEALATLDRYVNIFGYGYMGAADLDGDWLTHAINQLGPAMAQVSSGKKIDPLQIAAVQSVAEEALEAVKLQNEAAIAAAAVALLQGFMEGYLRAIENRARSALEKLNLLRAALEEAKRARKEAIVQGIVDGLIVVATVLQPELILLSGIKAAVGQKLMDDAFGGPKSSAAMDKLSTYSTNASIAQASLETFSFLTPAKSVPYIKGASKPLAVVGLAFDANEIYAAVKNVDSIRNAIDALMPVLRRLKSELDVLQPKVLALRMRAKGVRNKVTEMRDRAWEHSIEYRDIAKQVKLQPYAAVQWRIK